MERLNLLEEFCRDNPYDFSEEEFEKIRKDIVNPRKGVVYDEYVDFNLWMRGLKSRQEYFADYISEKLPIEKYRKLLEVGCGKHPRVSKMLAEKGYQMTSMDMVISCDYVIVKKDLGSADCENIDKVEKEVGVEYLKEGFDYKETDISEYDAIIAQEPCEATEHIVRACVEKKKDFIIALCGAPHKLINGGEPKDVREWYAYLQQIGGDNCVIIDSNMVPGYICPVMKGFFSI